MSALKYDLHCHSTASDGALNPTELVQRAKEHGVDALSLTDHDSTAGIAEAKRCAESVNIQLIPGIELSSTWNNKCLHIIGLDIDANAPLLYTGIQKTQSTRLQRAHKIALKLEKKHIPGAFEAVQKQAGQGMITRSHFADFLLHEGHVINRQEAFDYYLGKGKPAFVQTQWPELEQTVHWITQAGGIAVLAHPLRYKLTASWMRRLLADFKAMGGQGLEVISGRNNPDEIRTAADYAKRFALAGSVGSDFHTPDNPWVELGRLAALPDDIQPVWDLFDASVHDKNNDSYRVP